MHNNGISLIAVGYQKSLLFYPWTLTNFLSKHTNDINHWPNDKLGDAKREFQAERCHLLTRKSLWECWRCPRPHQEYSVCASGTAQPAHAVTECSFVPWVPGEPPRKCLFVGGEMKEKCCSYPLELSQGQQSDLLLQWPVRFGLNQPLFAHLSPRLSCGHWCCLQTAGGTCAVWFGSGELQLPIALSLLHVTFLWDLCVHFWVHSPLLIILFAGSITASGLGYEHRQKTTN